MLKFFKHLFYNWSKNDAQFKGMLLGLDDTGKTTLLHKLRNGQVTTSIPTIGMNLETFESPSWRLVSWDIGGNIAINLSFGHIFNASPGCDKSRPVWGRVLRDEKFFLFLIDLNDEDRFAEAAEEMLYFYKITKIPDGSHFFVLFSKEDLLSKDEKERRLTYLRSRIGAAMKSCSMKIHLDIMETYMLDVRTGKGLNAALAHIRQVVSGDTPSEEKEKQEKEKEEQFVDEKKPAPTPSPPTRAQLIERIKQNSAATPQDDAAFWQDFTAARIPAWNHYTHLRAGYIILLEQTELGNVIFAAADAFATHLVRLQTTAPERFRNTSHRTMTIFWLSRLESAAREYAAVRGEEKWWVRKEPFREVVMGRPELMDGGAWKERYSAGVMFSSEARVGWMEPDLKELGGEEIGSVD